MVASVAVGGAVDISIDAVTDALRQAASATSRRRYPAWHASLTGAAATAAAAASHGRCSRAFMHWVEAAAAAEEEGGKQPRSGGGSGQHQASGGGRTASFNGILPVRDARSHHTPRTHRSICCERARRRSFPSPAHPWR